MSFERPPGVSDEDWATVCALAATYPDLLYRYLLWDTSLPAPRRCCHTEERVLFGLWDVFKLIDMTREAPCPSATGWGEVFVRHADMVFHPWGESVGSASKVPWSEVEVAAEDGMRRLVAQLNSGGWRPTLDEEGPGKAGGCGRCIYIQGLKDGVESGMVARMRAAEWVDRATRGGGSRGGKGGPPGVGPTVGVAVREHVEKLQAQPGPPRTASWYLRQLERLHGSDLQRRLAADLGGEGGHVDTEIGRWRPGAGWAFVVVPTEQGETPIAGEQKICIRVFAGDGHKDLVPAKLSTVAAAARRKPK